MLSFFKTTLQRSMSLKNLDYKMKGQEKRGEEEEVVVVVVATGRNK